LDNEATNKIDKPEWMFNHIMETLMINLNILEDNELKLKFGILLL
jgi:hypothetical protein